MLEQVSKTDDFFHNCLERMRSTISMQYGGDVNFNDYKIHQLFKINHPMRKNRFDRKKELFDLEVGEDTDIYEGFHGSPHAWNIVEDGFNVELCHSKNRFGRGFYFAPESSKANMYAFGVNKGCPSHNNQACTRCIRQMLICRLAMGNTYIANKIGAVPPGYNSVVAYPKNVRRLHYPEIAVFHPDQILPIALIEYTITNEVPSKAANNLESAMESMKNPSDTWTTVLAIGAAVAGTAALIGLAKLAVDAFSKKEKNQGERRQQNNGSRRGTDSAGTPNKTEEECTIS